MGEIKTQNLLVAADSNNMINFWHTISGKCIYSIKGDETNNLYTIDYSKDGSMFACGGKDTIIRVYDDNTKQQITELKGEVGMEMPGHANRVYCVKFTNDPNILVSGGWDATIMIWDLRAKEGVGYIYGPYICGDSIDVQGDLIVTGSYNDKDCVQLWSLSERKLISKSNPECITQVYGLKLSQDGKYIAACGAGKNELAVLDNKPELTTLAKISGLPHPLTSLDFGMKNRIVCTSTTGAIDVYDFKKKY